MAINRFGYYVVTACLPAAFKILIIGTLRYHDNGNVAQFRIGFDSMTTLVAIHPGHIQVHVNNVGNCCPDGCQCFKTVMGDQNLKIVSIKKTCFLFKK